MIVTAVILLIIFGFSMVRAADFGDRLPGPKAAFQIPAEWQKFVERRFEQVN